MDVDDTLEAISEQAEELGTSHAPDQLAPLFEQRAAEMAPGEIGRAAWLSYAGEQWELADQVEKALRCYEAAVADGGPAWIDARASLASSLLDVGEHSRAADLLDELRRNLARGSLRGPVHEFIGEHLEIHDRLDEAQRWFTSGILHAEQHGDTGPFGEYSGCLNGRFRVRRVLGLPLDRYDEMAEATRRTPLDDAFWDDQPTGPPRIDRRTHPGVGSPIPLTALYWPFDQFAELIAAWPEMAGDYGAEHSEHREKVEEMLRQLADSGARVSVAPGDVSDYRAFAEREGEDPAESSTRAQYGTHLGATGQNRPWPPGRNEACWCGSGAKYKKCCGALRFSTSQAD